MFSSPTLVYLGVRKIALSNQSDLDSAFRSGAWRIELKADVGQVGQIPVALGQLANIMKNFDCISRETKVCHSISYTFRDLASSLLRFGAQGSLCFR
jgi:hypothetical protein